MTIRHLYHEFSEVKYPLMGCGWVPRARPLRSPAEGKKHMAQVCWGGRISPSQRSSTMEGGN